MFKFGCKVGETVATHGEFPIFLEDTTYHRLCVYTHWGFRSCGAALLSNFEPYTGNYFWRSRENVDKLAEWLSGNIPIPHGHNAQEFYFLHGTSNDEDYYRGLTEHPKVRTVDTFIKKPYGHTPLRLYRFSLQNDFDNYKKLCRQVAKEKNNANC